jgi:hypothetical protein
MNSTKSTHGKEEIPFAETKEDLWTKNNIAHAISRARKDCGKFCGVCMHRGCGSFNNVPVYGRKSLKKSKFVNRDKLRFYDTLGWASMD